MRDGEVDAAQAGPAAEPAHEPASLESQRRAVARGHAPPRSRRARARSRRRGSPCSSSAQMNRPATRAASTDAAATRATSGAAPSATSCSTIARSVLPVERHIAPRSAGVRAAMRTRRRITASRARAAPARPHGCRGRRAGTARARAAARAIAAMSTGSYGSSRSRCSFAGKYRKNVISRDARGPRDLGDGGRLVALPLEQVEAGLDERGERALALRRAVWRSPPRRAAGATVAGRAAPTGGSRVSKLLTPRMLVTNILCRKRWLAADVGDAHATACGARVGRSPSRRPPGPRRRSGVVADRAVAVEAEPPRRRDSPCESDSRRMLRRIWHDAQRDPWRRPVAPVRPGRPPRTRAGCRDARRAASARSSRRVRRAARPLCDQRPARRGAPAPRGDARAPARAVRRAPPAGGGRRVPRSA